MDKKLMDLDYPKNLVAVVFGNKLEEYPEDFEASVQYVLYGLKEEYRKILEYRFRDRLTLGAAGKKMHLTAESVRCKEAKALRIMRHPQRFRLMKYGVKKCHDMEIENTEKRYEREMSVKTSSIDNKKQMSVEEIEFSTREVNCIARAMKRWQRGVRYCDITINELLESVNNGVLRDTRNCGFGTMKSIISKLCKFGMESCIDKEVKDVYFE